MTSVLLSIELKHLILVFVLKRFDWWGIKCILLIISVLTSAMMTMITLSRWEVCLPGVLPDGLRLRWEPHPLLQQGGWFRQAQLRCHRHVHWLCLLPQGICKVLQVSILKNLVLAGKLCNMLSSYLFENYNSRPPTLTWCHSWSSLKWADFSNTVGLVPSCKYEVWPLENYCQLSKTYYVFPGQDFLIPMN